MVTRLIVKTDFLNESGIGSPRLFCNKAIKQVFFIVVLCIVQI